jgi:hypothetical protein
MTVSQLELLEVASNLTLRIPSLNALHGVRLLARSRKRKAVRFYFKTAPPLCLLKTP